ncbi:MAG: histidine kinase [Williamsia sp.]|nr:histidine kinase [Williamsia sp.]
MVRPFSTKNQRYPLLKVFWIVASVNLFFFLLVVGMIAVTTIAGHVYDWKSMFSPSNIARESVSLVANTLFFWITLNQFHRLITERKGWKDYLPLISISVVVIMGYQYTVNHTFVVSVDSQVQEKYSVIGRIIGSAISSLFIIGLSLLIAYLNNLRDEQKQRKILEQQKIQLEMENARANLNFLKAQINPHFLHNTLNFLYVKARPLSEELSEGIATLSDIMRYALSNANSASGQALLREEIEHLENVIKINRLRFNNNLPLEFKVEGNMDGARIIPFVLITLVENAFKHGDLQSPEHPVDIKIQTDGQSLHFYCRNKKKIGSSELSTKLGLSNIQKRLEQAYGRNHSFYVKDGAEFYTTELTIHAL